MRYLSLVSYQLDMPIYSSLKEVGGRSVLVNQWRSMHHRLRRRLERQGMVPKRKPGRPPKSPPMQLPGLTNVVKAALPSGSINVGMVRETSETSKTMVNNEREDQPKGEPPVQVGSGGGDEDERSLKRARTEEKTENEQTLPTRMQL